MDLISLFFQCLQFVTTWLKPRTIRKKSFSEGDFVWPGLVRAKLIETVMHSGMEREARILMQLCKKDRHAAREVTFALRKFNTAIFHNFNDNGNVNKINLVKMKDSQRTLNDKERRFGDRGFDCDMRLLPPRGKRPNRTTKPNHLGNAPRERRFQWGGMDGATSDDSLRLQYFSAIIHKAIAFLHYARTQTASSIGRGTQSLPKSSVPTFVQDFAHTNFQNSSPS